MLINTEIISVRPKLKQIADTRDSQWRIQGASVPRFLKWHIFKVEIRRQIIMLAISCYSINNHFFFSNKKYCHQTQNRTVKMLQIIGKK